MLYLLDSNILLYSKIDDAPEHRAVSKWLTAVVADPKNSILLCETSILAFLRIGTNKRLFNPPLPLSEAQAFLDTILVRPNVQIFRPEPKIYSELLDLMDKHGLSGDITMDGHLATIAMRTGATLVTRDGDFDRFPYLKLLNPILDGSNR